MFQGQSLHLHALDDGVVELVFDRQGDAINKFCNRTVRELGEAVAEVARLAAAGQARGLLVTSAKNVFIVGADITEFGEKFSLPDDALVADVKGSNVVFNALEDLPVPSVAAINGYALGGGIECTLACSLRVMSTTAQVGVPEVKLGLFPGFGGTVRLARLASPQLSIEWVAHGRPADADTALTAGVVDEVVAPESLRAAALALLYRATAGEVDWRARQERKRGAVALDARARADIAAVVEKVKAAAAPHQPAAGAAADMIAAAAGMARDAALHEEAVAFAKVAKTQAANALVQSFLSEQALKKIARQQSRAAPPLRAISIVGAGPIGVGIAVAAARRGVAARLHDDDAKRLRTAMADVDSALGGAASGAASAAEGGLDDADLVIVTVAESPAALGQRLSAIEARVRPSTVLAIATSAARIDELGTALERPGNLVGMHVVEPAQRTPLIEVVRGKRSSEVAVGAAVAAAVALGKTPIVVRDAPGWLIERMLTVQKNAKQDPIIGASGLDDAAAERCTLALIVEAARVLDEGVVATPIELDQALLMARVLPAHVGGALKHADWLGLGHVVQRCEELAVANPAFTPTASMRALAARAGRFYA